MLNVSNLSTLDHFQIRSYTPFGMLIRRTLKCYTNHNAPIFMDEHMKKWVLDIRYPRIVKYPIEDYERYLKRIRATYIVVRPNVVHEMEQYAPDHISKWRKEAYLYWASLEGQKYALRDMYVLFRKIFMSWIEKISLIDPDNARVYCTEGTNEGYRIGGWQPGDLGRITMKTPRLYELATRLGEFVYVDGYRELYEKIMANDQLTQAHPRLVASYA